MWRIDCQAISKYKNYIILFLYLKMAWHSINNFVGVYSSSQDEHYNKELVMVVVTVNQHSIGEFIYNKQEQYGYIQLQNHEYYRIIVL